MQDESKNRPKPKTVPKRAAQKPVDPIEVLEQIAGNRRLKPTPRVAAARELLKFKLALLAAKNPPAQPKTEDEKKTRKSNRLAEQLNLMALQSMNAKGSA